MARQNTGGESESTHVTGLCKIVFAALLWSCCVYVPASYSADTAIERGQKMFENSGCIACHSAAVEDRNALAGIEYEKPPRARILTKLRTLAAMLQDREARFGAKAYAADCPAAYRAFAEEYQRVHALILNGNAVYPMPSWQQRSGMDTVAALAMADADIDEVMAYLLVSEGLSLLPEQIAHWRSGNRACEHVEVPRVSLEVGDQQRREFIMARIEWLDKHQHAFDKLPDVTMLSYQNFLLNRIAFVEDGDLDIWTLRQADQEELYTDVVNIKAGSRFPNDALFIIVVDRQSPVYRAYFFKQPDMVYRWIYAKPRRFTRLEATRNPFEFVDADLSDCFGCHASGPLHLRPRQWQTVPELTEEEWSRLHHFNQRMLTYGPLITDRPASQPALDQYDLEQVTLQNCKDCHANSAIRSPLVRYHAKEIVALMNAHEQASGYFAYSQPNPDPLGLPKSIKTKVPSMYGRVLPAMPPLSVMTEQENTALFEWMGPPH